MTKFILGTDKPWPAVNDAPGFLAGLVETPGGFTPASDEEAQRLDQLFRDTLTDLQKMQKGCMMDIAPLGMKVPERLFPMVKEFPLGNMVLVYTGGVRRSPKLVEQFIEDVKKAFPTSCFAIPRLPNPDIRGYLRRTRNDNQREPSVCFWYYEGQQENFLDQEVDFTFHLSEGARITAKVDSLLVQVDKSRTPLKGEPYAVVYRGPQNGTQSGS